MPLKYKWSDTDWVKRRSPEGMLPKNQPNGGPYNFYDTYPDVRAALMAISVHGEDLIGAELGLYQAESFCTILQVCKNVKKLVGVDIWEPYQDCLGGNDKFKRDLKQIEFIYNTAINYINYCGESHRAEVLQMDTVEAASEYEDEYFDFVFFDAHLTEEQLFFELSAWYPKIKTGGLVIGHDWHMPETSSAVFKFRDTNNITNRLSSYDCTFIWKK